MSDVANRDRLQPSLLDRLTDNRPSEKQESVDFKTITQQKLRDLVLRDLSFLFNTSPLDTVEDLSQHPNVARSTLNYGVRDLTGLTKESIDSAQIERLVRDAIKNFEPRILPQSINVRVVKNENASEDTMVAFDIQGALWGQPVPLEIYLHTEIDITSGDISVTEMMG